MSQRTPQIWILHRDAAHRDALARRIAAGDAAVVGSPTDIAFETAAPPRVVVIGLAEDCELELEFAHRNGGRLGDCRWLLVTSERDEAELLLLFDTLDVRVLREPLSAGALRAAIRAALPPRVARDSLSLRRYRDRLAERFVRWFDDLEMSELLRAMNPKLARVPLVVRGEPGTGRALFARYVHTFGGDTAGGAMPFIEIDCAAMRSEADLLAAVAPARGATSATLLLEHLECIEPGLRGPLLEWIEYGLPPGTASGTRVRWAATLPPPGADEDADPDLLSALSGLAVSIPALRDRADTIAPFARATASSWGRATGRPVREIGPDAIEALELHSWPGNLRELESVLIRALAEHSDDPLEARHLRIDTEPAPLAWPGAEQPERESRGSHGDRQDTPEPDEPRDELAPRAVEEPGLARRERTARRDTGDRKAEETELTSALEIAAADEEARLPEASWAGAPGEAAPDDALPLIELGPEDLIEAPSTEPPPLETVDATDLIESLLDSLRSDLARRDLVVLKELDRRRPLVIANPVDLRLGLQGLISNLVRRCEEDGELYIASHHNAAGLRRSPALRILVRHIPGPASARALSPQLQVELALCEKVAEAAGGVFTLSEGASGEIVVVFDLPAPP